MTRTLTALIAALAVTATIAVDTAPANAWIDVLSIDVRIPSDDRGSDRIRGTNVGSGR